MGINDCKLVELDKIHDPRGSLTVIENLLHIPFEIKRVYYLYDVPTSSTRGGHAHKRLQQFLVALSGSCDILLDDGLAKKKIHLNKPQVGLHIVPGIWREMDNFSSNSVCLVLASELYDEKDYFRNYNDFLASMTSRGI